uniref:Bromelain inhibitor VI n=1 Tax=Siphoviridae sp. ctnpt50 TaxID=2827941 RepID=A0A8S5SDP5_9CAUD|nr:MAG TPA: Bromelain inhibitor VI [Siphoviridae sp. ctnpt50]
MKYRLFFCKNCWAGDGLKNGLEQMMCFKPVDFDEIGRFQRILKRILD